MSNAVATGKEKMTPAGQRKRVSMTMFFDPSTLATSDGETPRVITQRDQKKEALEMLEQVGTRAR